MVQLSYPYMTTGRTIALTRWTFAGKVMSLLFNTLFRFVIAFLPRCKHLLISWLQSLSTVILEPEKINLSLFPFFPVFFPWSDGIRCHDLSFWRFSHCCKSSKPHNRLSNLELWQRDWESPGNLTLKVRGTWFQNFHRTGETETLAEYKQNLLSTRTQEKGAVSPYKRLSQTCVWMFGRLWWRHGPTVVCL